MKKLFLLIVYFLTAAGLLAQTIDNNPTDILPPGQSPPSQTKVSSINITGNFNDLLVVVGFSDRNHNYPTLSTVQYYPKWGAFPDGTLLKDYIEQHGGSIPADEWYQPAFNYYYTELSGGLYNVNFNFVKSSSYGGTYLSNHPFSYWISQNGGSDNSVIYNERFYIPRAIADQLYNENPNIFNNIACIHFIFVGVTNCEFYYNSYNNKCSGGTIADNFSLKSVDGNTTYWTGPVTLQRDMGAIMHERLHVIGEISGYPNNFTGFPDRGTDRTPGEGYHNLNVPYDIMYHGGDKLPPLHSLYGEIPLTSPDLIFLGWIRQDEIETINSSNFTNYSDIKLADWSIPLTSTQISEGYRRIVKVMIHENYSGDLDEYFLLEYHNASGLDKAFENYAEYPLTGYNKGVLIWHIKEKTNMINQYSDNIMRLVAAVPYNGWYGNPIPDDPYRIDYTRSSAYNGVNSGEYNYLDDALINPTGQYLHMQDGGEHIWETTVVNDPNNTYGWDPTGQRLFWRLQSLSSDFFSDQSIKGQVTDELTDAGRPTTKDWGAIVNGVPVAYKTHIAITDITSHSGYMTVRVYYNYWTGNYNDDQTMNGNVIIGEDVTIPAGVTLTTESGTTLNFLGNYTLTVNGTLVHEGDVLELPENGKVTVNAGGTLSCTNNGSFLIKGTLNAQGILSNGIVLNFNSSNNSGIVVDSGGVLNINYCTISNANTGIQTGSNFNNLTINHSGFSGCNYGVSLIGGSAHVPHIYNSSFDDCQIAINASALNSVVIKGNTITNADLGIQIIQVPQAQVIGNIISSNKETLPGAFLNSSGGYVRANSINGHSTGITLGNSSPKIGANTITGNKINGIFIGPGSIPDLTAYLTKIPCSVPPLYYPLSGYNNIYENGGYSMDSLTVIGDDGSEIYISNANISVDFGCNGIEDNRVPDPQIGLFKTKNLMNGRISSDIPSGIGARYNAWGENPIYPLSERFGDLAVTYEPYVMEPCPLPDFPTPCPLIINDLDGNIIDTLYSTPAPDQNHTNETQQLYLTANSNYVSGQYDSASTAYNQIIQDNPDSLKSSEAYSKLYTIGIIQSMNPAELNQLRNFYLEHLNSITDSSLSNILSNLSDLCLVSEANYTTAIDSFDAIIQRDPESEEALYAEIDALTASLLANHGQMGKSGNAKYSVAGENDYLNKINSLLQKKMAHHSPDSKNSEIIPKTYKLYQNYPNPFNPTTTIKYDIPKSSRVTLKIYDILGREVRTLVNNEIKNPGSYRAVFDASSLASGVYLYRLQTDEYTNVKKMIVIK